MNKLGEEIRRIRMERRITQEEMSLRTNISVAQIRRIEYGQSNPTVKTILKITSFFDIEPEPFLELSGYSEQRIRKEDRKRKEKLNNYIFNSNFSNSDIDFLIEVIDLITSTQEEKQILKDFVKKILSDGLSEKEKNIIKVLFT